MPISPEKEPRMPVAERAEEFEISPELEDTGIEAVETAVKARVKDKGKHLIETPATKKITIKLPVEKSKLKTWAKGNPDDSRTGFAVFWQRMIDKAIHFGHTILNKGKN